MKILFNILKLVLLFAVINIAGRFLWPFAAYLTGERIGLLCQWVSGTVFAIGLIWLIISFIKKQSKRFPLLTITTACAFFLCYFTTINGRYGKYGHYIGEYIKIYGYDSDEKGLANMFGIEFVEPKYRGVLKVFEKKSKEYTYIGVERNREKTDTIDGEELRFYSYVLYMHDEKGDMKQIIDIKENDCDYIKEYIEKYIGKITENYGVDLSSYYHMVKSEKKHWESVNDDEENEKKHSSIQDENVESSSDNTKKEEVVVRHVHEKQQVWRERWKPCISCDPDRKGRCSNCHGQGGYYIGNYYNVCPSCSGTGACPWCGGRGEIMETYSVWE